MRKFILIAALVLVSATAQAKGTRSLTLAAGDQPKAVAAPQAAEAPKFVGRPPIRQRSSQRMKRPNRVAAQNRQVFQNKQVFKIGMPKRKRPSVLLARVVSALHRHGIYW
jgi:hypothetical protein